MCLSLRVGGTTCHAARGLGLGVYGHTKLLDEESENVGDCRKKDTIEDL